MPEAVTALSLSIAIDLDLSLSFLLGLSPPLLGVVAA